MHFLVIGVNHRTAPISVRERFSLTESQVELALQRLKQTKSVLECMIVSTCNRMELYAVVDKLDRGRDYLTRFVKTIFHVADDTFEHYAYQYEEEHAQHHLFRVTCGLDSMIVGETQILGQVRDFFLLAQQSGCTGVLLNTLFKSAITYAKRAHHVTGIANHPVSVGYAAVEMLRQSMGTFSDKQMLIIGAGDMAELTVKHLLSQGATHFSIVNRSLGHAESLARLCAGQAFPLSELQRRLHQADLVVSSTGAGQWLLTRDDVHRVMAARPGRPLYMMDLAMPRDLDDEIKLLPDVHLYNLDDLHGLVDFNLEKRRQAVHQIELLIAEALAEYRGWLERLGVVPLIKGLQQKADAIHAETMASLDNKLPELSERERKVFHKLSKSMLNQLLREPIVKIKELSAEPNRDLVQRALIELFGLGDTEEPAARTERMNEYT